MNRLKISVLAPHERPWSDVELVKECIVLPYLLYKNHGYDVTIVGAAPKGIPAGFYTDNNINVLYENCYKNTRYIPGLKFRLFEKWDKQTRREYIEKNGTSIDILYLRGAYELNVCIAPLYKKINKDGISLCALDANSLWMDKIYWYVPSFMDFIDSCDIMTTSCTAMANFLSVKWPCHVHSIINGFYNLTINHNHKVNFKDRENIILTVGRLGAKQKSTDVLLEAFAIAADSIPEWKLYLVGNIEDQFMPYLDDYLNGNKEISDRIVFTGSISDREELASYYENAKIYALTSELEGGTNNATAEALGRGLIPITSKIDAYEDITDNGQLGGCFEIGDVNALAQIMIDLCNRTDLQQESEKVYAYAEKVYDLERITGKLDELIKRNQQKDIH